MVMVSHEHHSFKYGIFKTFQFLGVCYSSSYNSDYLEEVAFLRAV